MTLRLAPALLALTACGAAARAPATAPDPRTTGSISGAVRDVASGEPLSFATVSATPTEGDRTRERTDTTDAHGGFRLDGLAPGTYGVRVYYANVSSHWQDVTVAAGAKIALDIDLSLADARAPAEVASAESNAATQSATGTSTGRGVLAGRVVDQATGDELEGAVVAVTIDELLDAQMAVTDEHGQFRIAGLPPGTYKLSCFYRLVDYGDVELQRSNIQVASDQTTTVALRLDTSSIAQP